MINSVGDARMLKPLRHLSVDIEMRGGYLDLEVMKAVWAEERLGSH